MMACRLSRRTMSSSRRAAAMKGAYWACVRRGSGRSRKNCFRRPATELTSWKKASGLRKSTLEESGGVGVSLLFILVFGGCLGRGSAYHC